MAKRCALRILTKTVTELLLAHDHLELPHHDRRLLVDDCAVERTGLVQVLERLPDGVRSGGAIDVIRGRVVRQQEAEFVIDRRKGRVDDFRGHEIRKHLLHPDIVEPAHRDQVTEPHVRGFMRDHVCAGELLILRRRLVEQQP